MKKKNSFVKQASFLMIAGLLVRIIGLLYKPMMKANIGELGYSYYSYAYNVYFILLVISGYSIPVAVSKLMSERLVKKQYKNAQRVFRGSLVYVLAAGGLASLAAFFFAEQLLPKGGSGAVLALQVLAPTILFAGILGVLRGYFQAHDNMMPTSVSQILEALVNAVIALSMGRLFIHLFAEDDKSIAVYGAAGSTMGPGAGVVIGILFMLLVFVINRRVIQKKIARDKTAHVESYQEIARIILLMLTPVILSTFVYNVNTYIDPKIFAPLMMAKGLDGDATAVLFNQYSGYYLVLINVPIALSNASSTAMIPSVSSKYALGEFREAKAQIYEGVRMTMFIAIPAAVGLAVLAFPILQLLFGYNTEIAGWMLVTGSSAVIFYSLSTITNGVLQGIGKQTVPFKNAAISLGIHIVVLFLLTKFTNLGAYAAMIANMVFGICMCILNQIALRKYLDYKNEYLDTYIKPLAASAVMGVAAWIIYYGSYILIRRNIVCLILAIPLACVIYLIAYVMITKMPEKEMRKFPMGSVLVKVMRVLRIY